jgi:hypothetical protein
MHNAYLSRFIPKFPGKFEKYLNYFIFLLEIPLSTVVYGWGGIEPGSSTSRCFTGPGRKGVGLPSTQS